MTSSKKKVKIKIRKDFGRFPGPRYSSEGTYSGEELKEYLIPKVRYALENNEKLVIDLDDTNGYGTSFLEEAFGGLIRHGFEASKLKSTIEFISEDEPYLIEEINTYINEAKINESL